jgi:hypothetical protein
MDMQSLIEKSEIGIWMKRSGKTMDDLDKYEKYEYEQTIKIMKIMMKQRDMVANATPGGPFEVRHSYKEQNDYNLMPELLDKVIELGLDIGVKIPSSLAVAFPDNDEDCKVGGNSYRGKIQLAGNTFRCAPNESTPYNDITMYVELAERIRDVNTELICLKEEFKLETERNKEIQDKTIVDIDSFRKIIETQEKKLRNKQRMTNLIVSEYKDIQDNTIVDMGNLLSRIEKQEVEINKQTEMTDAIITSIESLSEHETSELSTDINTELICLKEDLKLDIDRNKTQQDKSALDINNLLSRIESQEEKNNKQTDMINVLTTSIEAKEENIKSMIICSRIVFGVLIIVYITIEIYKNYNFESREDVCQVKQITHN